MSEFKQFTLHDFVELTCRTPHLGWVSKGMLSLLGKRDLLKLIRMNEGALEQWAARVLRIYHAMTSAQQEDPDAIDPAARREIAVRANVDVMEVSRFMRDFETTRSMLQTAGPFSRRRGQDPARVLGLVTNNPDHRDPSFLERRVPPRDLLIWTLFLLGSGAAFFLYQWLFPSLNR